jgi:hypothetical protein
MEADKARLVGSGALVGIVSSLIGSILFAPIVIGMLSHPPITLKTLGNDIVPIFFLVVVICLIYSVIPGAVGGICLAQLLSKRKRSMRGVWTIGMIVGACAGLITDIVVIYSNGGIDSLTIQFALIAVIITAIMGGFGSRSLAKKFNLLG